uniref:Uncharacterized protein n=1 Tax=viral metagenome TaxID=1070528 RepID=A0A6C0JSX6_9ZZZZ
MLKNLSRSFWTISSGTMVGYVENLGKNGILFSNRCIHFRQTTSNLSNHGELMNISIEKCMTQNPECLYTIQNAMENRQPVTIHYELDLLNRPTNGEVVGQYFLKYIKIDHSISDVVISRK